MKVLRRKVASRDARGEITDILERVNVDSITLVTSKKGAVRGNHYHMKTTQYAFILEGKYVAYAQKDGRKVEKRIVKKGDLVVNPPMEKHAFVALENSTMLACCLGPRAGTHYENDTFRLKDPISDPRK